MLGRAQLKCGSATDLRCPKSIVAGKIGGAMSLKAHESAAIGSPVGANSGLGVGQLSAPPVYRADQERQHRQASAARGEDGAASVMPRAARTRRQLQNL